MASVFYLRLGKVVDSFEVAEGVTPRQAMLSLFPDAGNFPAPTIAIINGRVRMRDTWDMALGGGDVVCFNELPRGGGGGGGSNVLSTVLQVAVLLVAAAATWYVGGTGALLGVSALGYGSVAGAAAGLAVYMGGMILMGQIAGQQRAPAGLGGALDAAQASPTYNVNSSGNQARMWDVEPEGFGRMKIANDYVTTPWMQYVDNEQWGYYVVALGRGLYEMESIQFGETVFWRDGEMLEGTGYDVRDIEMVAPGDAVTKFPDNVVTSTEVSGQTLFAPNDESCEGEGWIGPYVVNPPGTQIYRILLDMVLQQGWGHFSDQGGMESFGIGWEFQYQAIDDAGKPLSEWATLQSYSDARGTRTAQRLTHACDVTPGRYQVQGRRTSRTTGDGRALDTVQWAAMRGMLPGTLTYGQSVLSFRVRGTNALSQNASNRLWVVIKRKLPLYDLATRTWSEPVVTRSWAAAVSWVAKAEWGGRLEDNQIDLETLWSIDARLAEKGWFYDAYIDGPYLVWELVAEMCRAMLVIPRLTGTILSFMEDGPDRPVRYKLTPRHIVRDSFKVTFGTWSDDTPDDVVLAYKDAAAGFQTRDVRAKLPESESREPYNLTMIGIVDRDHAYAVAEGMSARNRWRRTLVDCTVEGMGHLLNQGDIVSVAHPRFKETASGVLDAWDEAGPALTLVCDMARGLPEWREDAPELYLSLTRPDGTAWGPVLLKGLAEKGDRYVATLDLADYIHVLSQGMESPFPWLTRGGDSIPTTWALHRTRMFERRMIVLGVTPQDFWHSSVKLCNDAPQVWQYNLPTPPWQGRGQLPVTESLEAPLGLTAWVADQAGPTLAVSWAAVPGALWYELHVASDEGDWSSRGRFNMTETSLSVARGPVRVRVRAATEALQSLWAEWRGDTNAQPPQSVAPALASPYRAALLSLSWPDAEAAEDYLVSVALSEGGEALTAVSVAGTSWTWNVEAQRKRGGPYRRLWCTVVARNASGVSPVAAVAADDPAPPAPIDADVTVTADSVTLNAVTLPADSGDAADGQEDVTGYIILRGLTSDFTAAQVAEMRSVDTLPFTWGGLEPGASCYFRIAARDAFYDLAGDMQSLRFSAVLHVTTAVESGGEESGGGGD